MEKSIVDEIKWVESTRYENLPRLLKVLVFVIFNAGLAIVCFYTFKVSIRGWIMLDASYYYLLITIYVSIALVIIPARKKDRKVSWYDLAAGALTLGIGLYFSLYGWEIRVEGWSFPSMFNFVLGLIIILLVLEVGRRMAGTIYLAVCIIFGCYPLFADYMPGIFFGKGYSFINTVGLHVFGSEGLIGLPTRAMGDYLIGFLVFAAVLIASGAGDFFINFALAVCGSFRGGPAKVSVVSSAFFGTISGSAVSNVVVDGPITIPTMIRVGYPPYYAAAIEAVTSTGGILMPPVMGAVAFVMAAFLGIEYRQVCIAAAIPAFLYYFALMMQIDAYAARVGIKGIPRKELPSLQKTIRTGWPFLAVILFLLWGLLYMQWEMYTPFYASGLMFLISFFSKKTMMTPKRIVDALIKVGTLISQTISIILPIGIIVSGLNVTGASSSFTAGLIQVGGGNLYLILLLGVVACYLLGMAGLLTPAYIFLAVTMAPAVIEIGHLNVLAVHLFIVYYAMISVITPPVALAAFVAASLAGADPMRTGLQAMRLGIVIYFIPFFFIFNPALIMQGTIKEGLFLFALALPGISLLAAGLEGYLWWVGKIGRISRLVLFVAGFLIVFPEYKTTIIGSGMALFVIAVIIIRRKAAAKIEKSHGSVR